MWLTKRKAGPALAGLLAILWLIYRRYTSRRRRGTRSYAGATSSVPARSPPDSQELDPVPEPSEDRRLRVHVAAAAAWHEKRMGESILGQDSGVVVYSSPQDPWLAAATDYLAPLTHNTEAIFAGFGVLVLATAMVCDYFGRAWPFAAAMLTVMIAVLLTAVSALLQGQKTKNSPSSCLLNAVEVLRLTSENADPSVRLHTITDVPASSEDAVWQAVLRRVSQQSLRKHGVVEGFARRGTIGVFVEVDAAASRSRVSAGEDAPGLISAFVLEGGVRLNGSAVNGESRSLKVHHYSAAYIRLCGPAAAAAAAAPMHALLTEAAKETAVQVGANDLPRVAHTADEANPRVQAVASEAFASALQLVAESSSAWNDAGEVKGMKLEWKDKNSRFPVVRGFMKVSAEELSSMSSGRPGGGRTAAEFCSEVFSFSCSGLARDMTDPSKGDDTLLHWWRGDSNCSLVHMTWEANPLQAAADGVFFNCRRRQRHPGVDRLTCVTVPAPLDIANPFAEQVETVRAGRSFSPQQLLLSVVDVMPVASGGVQVCCLVHLNPQVSRLLPTGVVRSALLQAPCRGASFVDMAKNLRLPNPIKIENLDSKREELVEVAVAGRRLFVSSCLAAVLRDPTPDVDPHVIAEVPATSLTRLVEEERADLPPLHDEKKSAGTEDLNSAGIHPRILGSCDQPRTRIPILA